MTRAASAGNNYLDIYGWQISADTRHKTGTLHWTGDTRPRHLAAAAVTIGTEVTIIADMQQLQLQVVVTDINQGVEYRYLPPLQEPRRQDTRPPARHGTEPSLHSFTDTN